jgi:hypothetical protein
VEPLEFGVVGRFARTDYDDPIAGALYEMLAVS